MKKLFILLLTILPLFTFAQYQVEVVNLQPKDLTVDVKGYNDAISTKMNVKFDFDEDTETLTVRMGAVANYKTDYTHVWLPVHEFANSEMGNYMKTRGVKMKKSATYTNQDNFLNISGKASQPSVKAEGMGLTGDYELKTNIKPKKIKMLDKQMVPLDGISELDLKFKVSEHAKNVKLTLHNPIPMTRKGSKGTVGYVGNDIVIDITLTRDCKNYTEMLKTAHEYEEIFTMGEDKVKELKKSSTALMKNVGTLLLNMYDQIDTKRFEDTGCEELQESYEEIQATVENIRKLISGTPPPPTTTTCDTKTLNAELKSTTKKLNNMVNDWSLAGDAASKAEKKAAFQKTVSAFDAKIASCKDKLDAKALKDYEFVKKLVK